MNTMRRNINRLAYLAVSSRLWAKRGMQATIMCWSWTCFAIFRACSPEGEKWLLIIASLLRTRYFGMSRNAQCGEHCVTSQKTTAEDTSLSRAFSFWVWLALVIRKRPELLSCQSRMTFVIDVFFGLVIFNIVLWYSWCTGQVWTERKGVRVVNLKIFGLKLEG